MDVASFVAPFFVALAIQFLHFAGEFVTGFKTFFPKLYGGAAFSNDLFVSFNMASYAVFTLACLAVVYRRIGCLLVPVLFYVIYAAIWNAISHTWTRKPIVRVSRRRSSTGSRDRGCLQFC